MNLEEIKAEKADLRVKFLAARKAMSSREVEEKSRIIISRLIKSSEFEQANMIHCFLSIGARHEVDTHLLIRDQIKKGMRVAIPVTDLGRKILIHSEIKGLDDLEVGTFGILEPKQGNLLPVSLEEIDLIVVPGVAFDSGGNRIGYGAGFYDGFLRNISSPKIALAYEWQSYAC